MRVVISFGGSLINPGTPDTKLLLEMARIIKKSRHSFGIVCGGGTVAREYAEAMREVGGSESDADRVAILATRQNAELLAAALRGHVHPCVLDDFKKAGEALLCSKAVVMGGTIPGITTDTDSVLLAEEIGAARIVNMTNVDGIYSEDPRKSKRAKKYGRLAFDELVDLATKSDSRRAGEHFVFDLLACKLIARSKIETHFVNGKNLKDVEAAIDGKKHGGTVVRD
jgi:uridylate kinase